MICVRPGCLRGLRPERSPRYVCSLARSALSRRGMWALAGRALAPWAAGAPRLLPSCSRLAAASDLGAACRLFSAAELKVTRSPLEGAGFPQAHGGRAARGSPARGGLCFPCISFTPASS